MRNMRVGILIALPGFSWKNENSAVVSYLLTIADSFKERGVDVKLFPVPPVSVATGIQIQSRKPNFIKKAIKTMAPSFALWLSHRGYFKQQKSILKECEIEFKDCDTIIEFLTYGSTTGAQLKITGKKKLVIIYDSPLYTQFKEMHKTKNVYKHKIVAAEEYSIRSADLIICYSESVKSFLLEENKINCKVQVIPCIVWKKKIIPGEKKNNMIGFIGSFLSWHKVQNLVQAFERIAGEFPELKLVLIGKGEEWNRIKKLVDCSKFKARIVLTGFVSETELEHWKSKFTVGVMPGSNWYGSPLKIFEYMEAGIPVIAPDTPTVRDLFTDGEHLLFIDKTDPVSSLSTLLKELLENETKRNALAGNAMTRMNTEFAKEKLMSKFVSLVKDLE